MEPTPEAYSVAEAKRAMRAAMRARLAAVSPAQASVWSRAIREHVLAFEPLRRARTVLIFSSLAGEPSTQGWLEDLAGTSCLRMVVFPRIAAEGRLALHTVRQAAHLRPGAFGIAEPDPARCPEVDAREIDAGLVPGLAFDPRGFRLGRGKGFYDRLLARLRPEALCCGVFFSLQEVAAVPTAAHDGRLPWIITEAGARPAA